MRIHEPPRFLLDENLSLEIASGVLRRNHEVNILRVGEQGAPGTGAPDPDILLFCERERRALVTSNRKSMPAHLAAFAAEGHHHWGLFEVRDAATISDIIEELLLLWGATDATEHIDQVMWIPEL